MSEFLSINTRDFIHGLVVAVGTAVLTTVYQSLQNGFNIDWKLVIQSALLGGLGYLMKKFSEDENGKVGGKL